MKYLLLPLAFVAGQALACPADDAKNASAAPSARLATVTKATPAPTPVATSATAKPRTEVAAKTAAEPRKSAPL